MTTAEALARLESMIDKLTTNEEQMLKVLRSHQRRLDRLEDATFEPTPDELAEA